MNKAIFLPLALLLLPLARAGDYGYEFLDDGDVLKAWNPELDYYFDTDTAMQFSNHYEEYWSENYFCLGYKNGDWEYKCTNELNDFTWNIQTDNSTYWRATGWKDVNWKGVDLRIAVRYTLNESQDDLIIEPYVENRDTINIPYDIGFAWHVRNIRVGMNETNNKVLVAWKDEYNLSDDLDVFYNDNLTMGEYIVEAENELGMEWMRLKWNAGLTDYLRINSTPSQYNAPITLMIKTTGLNAGQNKSIVLKWIDATCVGRWGDLDESPAGSSKVSDENTTLEVIYCSWEGACPAPTIEGGCPSSTEGEGFLECQLFYRTSTEIADSSQQGNITWANSPTWKLLSASVGGQHCTRYDDATNHAVYNNFVMPHNNFTDFRCRPRVKSTVWVGEPFNYYTCAISNQALIKKNNIWANNNTPSTDNLSMVVSGGISNCTYDFLDLDNDSEESTKRNVTWYINGLPYPEYYNDLVVNDTDATQCCITVYDDVFTTGNEAQVCTSDLLSPPLLTWQERRPTWIAGVFAIMALMFLGGGKKEDEEE